MSSAQGQKLTVFRPPQVSGLVAWFDASDPSSVQGNPVTQWTDKSSNGNSATATTGPTYTRDAQGRPCISFTGTQWFESAATVPATTHSLIAVHAPTYTNGSNGSGTYGGNSSLFRFQTIVGSYVVFPYYVNGPRGYITSFGLGAGDTTLVENSVAGTASIINANIAPTSQIIYKNGTQQSTEATTLTAGTSPSLTIGRYTPGNLEYYQGYVYEMIVYSATLTMSQRQSIEGYLGWKWGLQASLSNAHPYLTVNPETPVYPLYPFTVPNLGTTTSIFTPTQVPGCAFWFDGADQSSMSFSSSSNLTQWRDKSGNSYNATASGSPGLVGFGSSSPGGVYFNGTTAYLSNFSCPINLSQRAVFIVMSEVVHANYTGVVCFIPNPTTGSDYQTITGMSIETTNGLRFYANSGAYISDMGNATLLPKSIYFDSMSATQGGSFLNGTNTSNNVANFTQGTCTGFTIGARWGNGVSSYTNSIINEIIVYSNPITTAQRQAVEAYLSVKWGTGALLASSNIYNQRTSNSFGLAAVVPIPVTRPVQNAKWLPTRISSLQLWLDAADVNSMILSGLSVTQWNDKSGSGNHVLNSYITGTLTYATRAISTSGTSNYFYAPVTTQRATYTNFQVFIVYTWLTSTAGTNQALWGGEAGGWNRLQLLSFPGLSSGADSFALSWGNQGSGFANPPNGVLYTGLNTASQLMYHASYNGFTTNGSALYINGVNQGSFTDSASVGSPNPVLTNTWFSAIGPASGGAYPAQVTFNEILIYTTTLTDRQRQSVEGYFAWKWGLVASLPANHPFKLFPPPPQ